MGEKVHITPDGMTAHMDMEGFTTPRYMSQEERVSPMGLLTAMIFESRTFIWTHPDYIMTEAFKMTRSFGWFIICTEYNFYEPWQHFIQRNAKFERLSLKSGDMISVILKEPVKLKSCPNHIGDKTFQVEDLFWSQDGIKLASCKFLYGLVDLKQRKMVPLPDKIRVMARNIENPVPLMHVQMKQPPSSVITRKDVIRKANIDGNNHTNVSFYFEVANKAFRMVKEDLNFLEKFVILFKKETVLDDTLESTAWNTNLPGQYCCQVSCHDRLVMFCEATFKEYAPKL